MIDSVIKDIANTVRTAVDKHLKAIEPRLTALEAKDTPALIENAVNKLSLTIPMPKELTVEDVQPSIDAAVAKAVEAIEIPSPKELTVEDVQPSIDAAVAKAVEAIEIPSPKELTVEDVQPSIDAAVAKAVEAIEIPSPRELTVEDVQPSIDAAVAKAVEAIEIPSPKELTVEDVQPSIDAAVTKAVEAMLPELFDKIRKELTQDINEALIDLPTSETLQDSIDQCVSKAFEAVDMPEPKNGVDGKDALEIQILPAIDIDESYSRGKYATHEGGLWRSFEKTHGMRGWECIVNGIKSHEIEYDGHRKVVIKCTLSNGEESWQELKIPAVIGKGVWREGVYEVGDMVQLSGSSWLCVSETDDRPAIDSKAWLLAAKKGGTGDSTYDIARKAGFEGDKQAFLEASGLKTVVKVK